MIARRRPGQPAAGFAAVLLDDDAAGVEDVLLDVDDDPADDVLPDDVVLDPEAAEAAAGAAPVDDEVVDRESLR